FDEPFEYIYEGEGQERRCIVTARLAGHRKGLVYETPPLKQITPKRSPLWQSDPDQQLAYYARRSWCRKHRPDVLLGVSDVDELPGQVLDVPRDVTPVREVSPNAAALQARLASAKAAAGAETAGEGF